MKQRRIDDVKHRRGRADTKSKRDDGAHANGQPKAYAELNSVLTPITLFSFFGSSGSKGGAVAPPKVLRSGTLLLFDQSEDRLPAGLDRRRHRRCFRRPIRSDRTVRG